jgi:hypothetical protein
MSAQLVGASVQTECERMHIRAFQKEERTSATDNRRAKMLTHTFYRCPFGSN